MTTNQGVGSSNLSWVTKNRQYRKRTVCFYLRKKVYNEKKFRGVREYKKAAKG